MLSVAEGLPDETDSLLVEFPTTVSFPKPGVTETVKLSEASLAAVAFPELLVEEEAFALLHDERKQSWGRESVI